MTAIGGKFNFWKQQDKLTKIQALIDAIRDGIESSIVPALDSTQVRSFEKLLLPHNKEMALDYIVMETSEEDVQPFTSDLFVPASVS